MFGGGYLLYIILSLPALILGLWAQAKIRSSYSKYSKVRTTTGLSGAEVARRMLDHNGLSAVRIEQVTGNLTDHYDPAKNVLRLSQGVYNSPSIAAAGVAAHEVGHALQDKEKYGPLVLRSLLVPTVQIGSWLGPSRFCRWPHAKYSVRHGHRCDWLAPVFCNSLVFTGHTPCGI